MKPFIKVNKFYLSVFLLFLSAVVYWNTLSNEFVWDDYLIIFNNRYIAELSLANLAGFFTNREVYTFAPGDVYRPLYMVSFALNYWLWGYDPFGYHLVNIVFHALNTVLVFLAVGFMFEGKDIRSRFIPFLTGLIFAVHPIHTESVAWVKDRDDLMSMFFMLLAFCFYIRSGVRSRKSDSTISHSRFTIHYFLSLIFYTFALLSKEMAITFPLILLLYDWLFGERSEVRGQETGDTTGHSRFTIHRLINYLPFWILSLVYMVARTIVLGQVAQTGWYRGGGSFLATMYTMTRGVVFYMKLLVLPLGLSGDYSTFPVSYSMDTDVLLSLFIIALVFILGIISVKYLRGIGFGIFWFFITLLPVSNIVPLKFLIAERVLYMPSLGFSIMLAVIFSEIGCKLSVLIKARKNRGFLWESFIPHAVGAGSFIILSLLVIFYSTLTIERNKVWRNEYTFWTDVIKRFPDNTRAPYNLGNFFKNKGMFEKAVIGYKKAIKLSPHSTDARNNLGIVYQELGLLTEAEREFKEVLRMIPYHNGAHNNLGFVYYKMGLFDKAISEYKVALELNRGSKSVSGIYMNLGEAYGKKGLVKEAIEEYRKVLRVEPAQAPIVHYNLGRVLSENGLLKRAVKEYRKALKIAPDWVGARKNLGVTLKELGLLDEAIEEFETVVRLRPDYSEAHYDLAMAYEEVGSREAAIKHYRKFIEIAPLEYQLTIERAKKRLQRTESID